MEYPGSGIVADTRLMGVNCFVQLASGPVVVGWLDVGSVVLGNSVDQTESLFQIFPGAPVVPGIVEREGKAVVSHREIRIDCGGALEQWNSGQKMAPAHLGMTLGVVLKSFQRRSGSLFQRTIQLLDRVMRFSQLAPHGRRRASHCVQHV